jgi:hypothetical protein
MNVPPSINKYNKEMLINGKQVRKRNYFPRNENDYSIILPPLKVEHARSKCPACLEDEGIGVDQAPS